MDYDSRFPTSTPKNQYSLRFPLKSISTIPARKEAPTGYQPLELINKAALNRNQDKIVMHMRSAANHNGTFIDPKAPR